MGPLLRSIGAQRSRAELLESLVNPVAKIAPGYGLVSVTLKDGRTVQIARDPDDAFHFQGEALGFRMEDGQGELSQDEGGTVHCTAG